MNIFHIEHDLLIYLDPLFCLIKNSKIKQVHSKQIRLTLYMNLYNLRIHVVVLCYAFVNFGKLSFHFVKARFQPFTGCDYYLKKVIVHIANKSIYYFKQQKCEVKLQLFRGSYLDLE